MGFHISCKFSPISLVLLSGKNKENAISLLSAEFASSILSVNGSICILTLSPLVVTCSLLMKFENSLDPDQADNTSGVIFDPTV